jgi:transcriptional regulator with XRE-family HTH domain
MTYSINSPEMKALLEWLKAARESKGLTMRELSARLGKPHSYVQKVEQGERRLDVVEFVWYCEALEINPVQGIKSLMS